jgi:hypothetical protein
MKEPFKKFQARLSQMNPEGILDVVLDAKGSIGDLKSLALEADIISPSISLYGLRSKELTMHYSQSEGNAAIALFQLSLYDGAVAVNAHMDLNSSRLPYRVNAAIKGVKIEKLKLDTQAKDKELSGTINAGARWQGEYGDVSAAVGQGSITVTEGKLWELDMFKGLGGLIFANDFSSVVFNEASCDFLIKDKSLQSENLALKSHVVNLGGPLRLGFDGTLDGTLNVQIPDETVPLASTFRDVTSILSGQAGRFAAIKISGTLREPKYTFKSTLIDILKGLKNAIFR